MEEVYRIWEVSEGGFGTEKAVGGRRVISEFVYPGSGEEIQSNVDRNPGGGRIDDDRRSVRE